MNRVIVAECLELVQNRFTLVHIASKRVKEIDRENKSAKIKTESRSKDIIRALKEIASGKIKERE